MARVMALSGGHRAGLGGSSAIPDPAAPERPVSLIEGAMAVVAERRLCRMLAVAHRTSSRDVHVKDERGVLGPLVGTITPGLLLGKSTTAPGVSPLVEEHDLGSMRIVAERGIARVLAAAHGMALLLRDRELQGFDTAAFV
jgi:hypothetical protein